MDGNEQTRLQDALEKNLNWFRHSGIMLPSDGMWGVGERIAVTNGNDAIEGLIDSTFSQLVISAVDGTFGRPVKIIDFSIRGTVIPFLHQI